MSVVAPVITEGTSDQDSYAPEQVITVTLRYTPGASDTTVAFTGTATDQTTGQSGQMTGSFSVQKPNPTDISVQDADGRTWTKVSDDGSVAVFTAKA